RYLRVAFSSLMRAATVQEVVMTLRRCPEPAGSGAKSLESPLYELREMTRDGVYDPILLKRFQKLVDVIVQAGVTHIDFGMVCEDAPSEPAIDFGDYAERYGATPSVLALLFYPRPSVSESTLLVPAV